MRASWGQAALCPSQARFTAAVQDFGPETTAPSAIADRGIGQPAPSRHKPPGSPPDPSGTCARLWAVHRSWQPTKHYNIPEIPPAYKTIIMLDNWFASLC